MFMLLKFLHDASVIVLSAAVAKFFQLSAFWIHG